MHCINGPDAISMIRINVWFLKYICIYISYQLIIIIIILLDFYSGNACFFMNINEVKRILYMHCEYI